MSRNRRMAVALVAVCALVIAGCTQTGTGGGGATATSSAPPTSSAPASSTTTTETSGTAQVFTATLTAVNGSGVSGVATVTAVGTALSVTISATGLVPGQTHAQHIHSKNSGPSTCPPEPTASGTVIPESQAEQYYGAVLVPLEPFPTADASGNIGYTAQVTGVPANAVPLEGRAIVLHGLMVNGQYDATVPVACGELIAATGTVPPSGTSTGTGTGDSGVTTGGTATTSSGGGTAPTTPPSGQGGAQTAPNAGVTSPPSP